MFTNPKLKRLAVLWHAGNTGSTSAIRELEAIAEASKITLQNLGIRNAGDLSGAFAAAAQKGAEAVYVVLSALIYSERAAIGALALKYRLPTIHGAPEFIEVGGLVSYGPSYAENFRRAAIYVDKILKGAKAGNLPIEQPSKFDLVINLKTAKTIAVAIPQEMLVRASRIID